MKTTTAIRSTLAALALLSTVAVASPPAYATTCTSSTIGGTTFTDCYGPNGSYGSGTTTRIGDSYFTDASGRNQNGQRWSGNGTTTRIGDSSSSIWSTWP